MLPFNENRVIFEDGEIEELKEKLNSFDLPETRFSFINDHKGFRAGKRHVLIGTTGTGKSTLTRSLLLDVCATENVLLYSTEESLEDTKAMFALRGLNNLALRNLTFVSESEILKATNENIFNLDEWRRILGVKLLNSGAKMLFFDNITTSTYYDSPPIPEKLKFLNIIDSLAAEFNIAVFIVAHTKKGIKDDQQTLITADDIAGPNKLATNSPYLYIYQQLACVNEMTSTLDIYGTIKVKKARLTGEVNNYYLLEYNYDRKEYTGDLKIAFSRFNELYNKRARLGHGGNSGSKK